MKNYFYISVISIFFLSCNKEGELNPVTLSPVDAPKAALVVPSDAFNIKVINDSAIADGVTAIKVLLKLDTAYLKSFKNVSVSLSTIGKFSDGSASKTVSLDANGEFIFYVFSTSSGLCSFQALLINSISKQTTLYFNTSYPDRLEVYVNSGVFSSSFSTNVSVTAKLFRSSGSYLNGLAVQYYDSTAINTSIGTFINKTIANTTGESTATFALQDTSYHGYVYLLAKVTTPAGQLRNFNKIRIQ